jgi:TonB-linked SusC/RagA family outer membrane protein
MLKTFKKVLLARRLAFMIPLIACLAFTSMAQVNISGKVTDASGKGISNAQVSIVGTSISTSTDNNGAFTLSGKVSSSSVLIEVNANGYKTKMSSGVALTASDLVISLAADNLKLDEVIVTGTSSGTTRKQLGSYIATVKSDQINKGVPGNALQALQGKTAGAQISQNSGDPAGGLSVRLRGISSVNSGSDPLYIVDGVIINNATNRVTNTSGNYDGNNFVGSIGQSRMVDINPADIERIEVLNGAAAAAIYGSRANAGVVQIFTKRGSSGAPVVTVSTSIISSSLRKSVPVNSSPTKFGGPTDGAGAQTQDILTPSLTTTTAVSRYDYNDYIFRNAIGTDNNISVAGGKDRTKYYASASYYNNQGIIKNTDFKRYSFRMNLDQVLSNKLSFSMGLNYVNSGANEKPDGNSFFSPLNSINIIGNFHDIFTRDANNNVRVVGERGRVNPVSIIEDIKQKQETNRIIANAGLKFKPIAGLTLDYTLGIDQYNQDGSTLIPPFPYNVSTAFFGGGVSIDPSLNGYASKAANSFFQINNDINATYNKAINENWSSTTQVGYSLQYEKNNYQMVQGRGLVPGVQTVTGFATAIAPVDDRSEFSVSGIFLQQNFKFKNKLFVTAAIRRDGSTVFSDANRNQTYKKFSAAYTISDDAWWTNAGLSKFWDFAKVRLSYGESGNLTGIGAYSRFNSYTPSPFLNKATLNPNTVLANTNVKPERQNEVELGFEFAFFQNRLNVQANIYNKKVSDLLINRFVAPTTGFNSLLDNYGSLTNKGFELILNGEVIRKKDWGISITEIFNRNRNKINDIGSGVISFATNGGAPIAIISGYPVGVFYGTFFGRDGGNLVKNGTGYLLNERGTQLTPNTFTTARDGSGLPTGTVLRKIIGDPNPDFTGSTVINANYKALSFRMQWDYVQGGEVFNADWRTRQGVGNGLEAEKEQRGQYPRGYINALYAIEEWRIDDGSFVKLRELSLAYNFGNLKGFKDLTLSFAGRNLLSIDNYKGYDPEVNAGGQSTLLRGIDFGAIPIPKTFSVGVTAKF